MSKKLFIGLVPLVVTAAFVVIPAAAQAAPHWYVGPSSANNVPLAPATETPTISWGTLELTSTAGAPIRCQNVLLGDAENPAGNGPAEPAGVGPTEVFATYDCEDVACPETSGVELTVEAEKLPWVQTLETGIDPISKSKLKSVGVQVAIDCVIKGLIDPADEDEYKLAPGGGPFVCTGESDLKIKDGKTSGPVHTKAEFGTENPTLACGALGPGTTTESLKTMGYLGDENIMALNP